MKKHRIKTWNLEIATLSQEEPDSVVDCSGCPAPCCKMLSPALTSEELLSGKYPLQLSAVPPEIKKQFPTVKAMASLSNISGLGCVFFRDGKCACYEDRPKSCRVYDCRKDTRPEIVLFVKERFK